MTSSPSDSALAESPLPKHANSVEDVAAEPSASAESKSEPEVAIATTGHFFVFAAIPSWLASMIVHVLILLVLALIALPLEEKKVKQEITLSEADVVELEKEIPVFELDDQILETDLDPIDPSQLPDQPDTPIITNETIFAAASDLDSAARFEETTSPLGLDFAPKGDSRKGSGITGSGVDGRGKASKSRLLKEAGGTKESEKAVQMALEWLIRHQRPDGSWCFDHRVPNCNCGNKGTHDAALNGATAMALLPFLGAGHTHLDGKYKTEIKQALYFLLTRQKGSGSFAEPRGNLYSHGLCSIVLSEAYAMTKDKDLMLPTQAALNYIAFAQDPIGGGWRYEVKQPGDTSVVGWQLMALKSGKMAHLDVYPRVFVGAAKFLDSVQTDDGAAYGYADPGSRNTTTAIALLCRMYLGWDRNHPALKRGIARMDKSGPSNVNMYYNYYATQVMRHHEGETWKRWNRRMRDYLIEAQEKKGHMSGSWHMGDNHSSKAGGRLYNTSLATMVLEVYYRHMPIYQQQATEDDFEL